MDELDSELIEQLFDRYLELDLEGVEGAAERALAEAPNEAVREELRRQIEVDRRVLAAVPDVLDVNQRLGNYRLIEEIARGGQGIVYRAEQPSLGRDVAIKVLPPDRSHSREHRKKLADESRLLGGLQHPSIVNAIELLATDRGLCLVMSYLPFPSMQRLLEVASKENIAPLEILRRHSSEVGNAKYDPVRLACQLFESAARGLDAAHRAGVLHGDVKPSNLLIGKDGHPYLIDFGLATLQGPPAEEGLRIHGTLPYVAPEILQRGQAAITPASDVYGLAATLYELLAGQPIFQADRFLELLRLAREEEVPALRTHSRRIAPELDLILRRALDRDPAQRTQTALAFAEDLARFREGRALDTSGEGLRTRVRLAWRVAKQRHRLWIGAAVAALVLTVAAVLLWPESNFGKALAALDASRSESLVALLKSAREDGSFDSLKLASRRETLSRFLAEAVAKQEIEDAHYYCTVLREIAPLQEADQRLAHRLEGQTIVRAPLDFPHVRLMRSNATGEFLGEGSALELTRGADEQYLALGVGFWRVVFDLHQGSGLTPSYLIRCTGGELPRDMNLSPLWNYEDSASKDWVEFKGVDTFLGQSITGSNWPSYNPNDALRCTVVYPFKMQRVEYSMGRYRQFRKALMDYMRRGERPPFVHPDDVDFARSADLDRLQVAPEKPLGCCTFYDAFAIATWSYARLPTEQEWEGCARIDRPRNAPYAFDWPPANIESDYIRGFDPEFSLSQDHTEDFRDVGVDPLPKGNTLLLHMYDNVGELTSTIYRRHGASAEEGDTTSIVLKGFRLAGNEDRVHEKDGLFPAWVRTPVTIARRAQKSRVGMRLAAGTWAAE